LRQGVDGKYGISITGLHPEERIFEASLLTPSGKIVGMLEPVPSKAAGGAGNFMVKGHGTDRRHPASGMYIIFIKTNVRHQMSLVSLQSHH
jgi:hypothetical protein